MVLRHTTLHQQKHTVKHITKHCINISRRGRKPPFFVPTTNIGEHPLYRLKFAYLRLNNVHMRGYLFLLIIAIAMRLPSQNICNGVPGSNTIVPSTQTICSGNSAVMALAGTYSNVGYTYQWKASPASISGPYTTVIGANSASFSTGPTFTTGANTHTIFYQAIITCTSSGQSITLTSTLYILPCTTPCSGTPAANVVVPTTGSICTGAVPALSLTTTNTLTGLTYQWSNATAASGPFTAVPGATQAAYAGSTLNTGVYYFRVVTTCTNSSATNSAIATVTVKPCHTCFGTPGTNTIVTPSPTICAGSSPSFSLANTYTNLGYSYQWFSSSVSSVGPYSPISNATLTTYTAVPQAGTKYYMVAITCTVSGQTFSTTSIINVTPCATPCAGSPATTAILPLTQTVCLDELPTMSLSTTYTSSGITYQWKYSPAASGPFNPISSATLANYTGSASSVNGYYQCVITCSNSSQSTTAQHTVTTKSCTYCAGPPSLNTIVPQTYTICAGLSPSLSLLTTYTNTGYTYQWQASTISVVGPFNTVSGAIQPSLGYTPIQQLTHFNVIITCTNSGHVTNAYRTVSVVACQGVCTSTPDACDIIASRTAVCTGENAVINFYLSHTYTQTGLSYQWMSSTSANGPFTNIIGASAPTYSTAFTSTTTYFAIAITCTNSNTTYTTQIGVKRVGCIDVAEEKEQLTASLFFDASLNKVTVTVRPDFLESEIIFFNPSGAIVAYGTCNSDSTDIQLDQGYRGLLFYIIKSKTGETLRRGKLVVGMQQ